MGGVNLNGLFEPGTAVQLFQVPDENALTADAGYVVGRRLVDAKGRVGFDGIDAGVRLIARGFDVYGNPLEVRCVGKVDPASAAIAQAPIRPVNPKIGTQEADPPEQKPAEPSAILQSGVPRSAAA